MQLIKERQETISFFMRYASHLEFNRELVDFLEYYLGRLKAAKQVSSSTLVRNTLKRLFKDDQAAYVTRQGPQDLFANLHILYKLAPENEIVRPIAWLRDVKKHLQILMENALLAEGIVADSHKHFLLCNFYAYSRSSGRTFEIRTNCFQVSKNAYSRKRLPFRLSSARWPLAGSDRAVDIRKRRGVRSV